MNNESEGDAPVATPAATVPGFSSSALPTVVNPKSLDGFQAPSGYKLVAKDPKPQDKEEEGYWETFFNQKRGEKCNGRKVLRYELQKIGVTEEGGQFKAAAGGRSKIGSGPFGWIKQWGFGPSAYLFDYFDPALRPLVLEDFAKIWEKFKGYPAADTKEYKDPFNLEVVIPEGIDDVSKQKLEAGKLAHDQAILTDVYKASVNAVQLNAGIKENKWYMDKSVSDNAKAFIRSYDVNQDGRVSARELILGSIFYNKGILGSDECTMCYEDLVDKIDGIFAYVDCNNDGAVGAEELWEHLPALRRDTTKWNFFNLASKATIRTAVVNDFILKNHSSVNGMVNKNEFRMGVLLGFWDRQTDNYGIISDDKINLKANRWIDDEVNDRGALEYIKGKAEAEAEARRQKPVIDQSKLDPKIEVTMKDDRKVAA